jgi:hypothetical protein
MNVSLGTGIFLLGAGMGAVLTKIAVRGQSRRLQSEMNLLLQKLRQPSQTGPIPEVDAVEDPGLPISEPSVRYGD